MPQLMIIPTVSLLEEVILVYQFAAWRPRDDARRRFSKLCARG
jgi:hypothetical protein